MIRERVTPGAPGLPVLFVVILLVALCIAGLIRAATNDAPAAASEGFYRSFNSHFNTMIITHEIYPGHYLQLKAAARHPVTRSFVPTPGSYAGGRRTSRRAR